MFKVTLVLAVLAMIVLAALVVWSRTRDQERAWDEAMQNPQWEVSEHTSADGLTDVYLALTAREELRSHTLRTTQVGAVDITKPGWEIELEILREKAAGQAEVLNRARNKGGTS